MENTKKTELFKKTKNNLIEENEKKVFSQMYILYDNSNVLKQTFVSEIEQYVNIFSQFTISCEKSNKNFKNFTKNNNKKIFPAKE